MSDGATFDPDERIPCTDDSCTGILGEDGRCGTCGRAADGSVTTVAPESARDEEPAVAALRDDEPALEPSDEPSDDMRTPCPDDLCTGVLGAGGRCGTCGRTADQISG